MLQNHPQPLAVTCADTLPIPGSGVVDVGMTLAVVTSSSMAKFAGFNLAGMSAPSETCRKEPGHPHPVHIRTPCQTDQISNCTEHPYPVFDSRQPTEQAKSKSSKLSCYDSFSIHQTKEPNNITVQSSIAKINRYRQIVVRTVPKYQKYFSSSWS